MKKTLSIFLAFIMTLALTACGQPAPGEGAAVVNPVHEVTVEGLLAATGLALAPPEGVESIGCSYIDRENGSPIAQLRFTADGVECCYRAVSSGIPDGTLEDISGLYYEWTGQDSAQVGQCEAELYWIEGQQGRISWYDYAPGILYSLSVDSGAGKDMLVSLAGALFLPAQGEEDGASPQAPACVKDSGGLSADLDGDGSVDAVTITQRTVDEFDSKEYGFTLEGGNGLSVVQDELYICSKPVLWLADIDGDSLPEILFSGDSGSDDYYTGCFKWDGGVLSRIHFDGYTDGVAQGSVEAVSGGVITLGAYSYVLGTYGGKREFTMNADGLIRPVEGSIWSFEGNEQWLTAARDLPGGEGGDGTLPGGTELRLTGFDGEGRVFFVTRDGAEGSIAVAKDQESWGWTIDGVPETECFEFLPYAG